MPVGKNSINRAVGKKETAPVVAPATPATEAEKAPVAPKAPAKKPAAQKAPKHGNYVLITEELPVWLL